MGFWDQDTPEDHAQQEQQKAGSAAAQSDPEIQAALRGQYAGKYAELAAKFPAAWPASIRNAQVAQAIAYDKGIDTSGLDTTDNFSPTNKGTPFAVQIAPYVIGGVTGAAALSSAGGAGGAAQAVAGGGPATAEASVPGALAPAGGGGFWGGLAGVGKGLAGVGGKTGGSMGVSDWLGPVLNAGLNIYGQGRQIAANAEGLDKSLAATKYAADSSAESQREALAFQKQQYAYDSQVAETNRRANYDQWASKQGMLGSVGTMLGLPARTIPDYVPLPSSAAIVPGAPAGAPGAPMAPPQAGPAAAASAPPPAAAAGAPAVSAANGPIGPQVAAYFAARGVQPYPTSVDQWGKYWDDWGSKDPAYFNQRLAAADEFGSSGRAAAPAAVAQRSTTGLPMGGSVLDYISNPVSTTGQLSAPGAQDTNRFRPLGGPVSIYL